MKRTDLAVLILAAGTSSRLGEPKQLVKFKEKTLIQIAIENALEVSSDVFVVLGEKAHLIIQEIIEYPISILVNENYKDGIGSSISYSMLSLRNFDKTLVMLCDQPLINSSHLKKIVEKSKQVNSIVCSYYKEDVAVPVLFPKHFYSDLSQLKGDKGAKAIIKNNIYESIFLDDSLAFDIDTKNDKKKLLEFLKLNL